MIDKAKIEKITQEYLQGSNNFLIDIKVKPGNKIFVILDSETNITIGECAKLSRYIENQFDRDLEDFELNVSSAGADQPFTRLRQYKKYLGKMIEVILKNGLKYKGKLLAYDDNGLKLELELTKKQRKENAEKQRTFNFEDIKETKGAISFK